MTSLRLYSVRFFLVLILAMPGFVVFGVENSDTKKDDRVIKILAIGNSFSADAVEQYLYELADAADISVIIGNLYIGGAPLSRHLENANKGATAYSYRKITPDGEKAVMKNTSLATALADEEWDYISFQQASSFSGQFATFEESLPPLFKYVTEQVTNPDTKYILHQTWAYAQNSTHKGFSNYDRNQMTMYKAIVDAVNKAKKLVDIDFIVPAGTAIQNGRTSEVGDNFTRDGYHLDLNIGRYTAACTWFEAIFKKSVVGNPYKPESLTPKQAQIAQKAAHLAVKRPNKVSRVK